MSFFRCCCPIQLFVHLEHYSLSAESFNMISVYNQLFWNVLFPSEVLIRDAAVQFELSVEHTQTQTDYTVEDREAQTECMVKEAEAQTKSTSSYGKKMCMAQ